MIFDGRVSGGAVTLPPLELGNPRLEVLSYSISNVTERTELFLLRAVGLRGVGEAPMQAMSGGGKDRAVLTCVIAYGNHIVPGEIDELVQGF